jgi:hypothetical protein
VASKRLFSILGLSILGACSSGPVVVQVEEVPTTVERPNYVSGEWMGLRDGVVVVQRRKQLSEELRKLQNEVFGLEDEIYGSRAYGSPGLYGVLKKCRNFLADKRIGGSGKLNPMEAVERPTEQEKDFKFGIDDKGNLLAVDEEVLVDRISRFRGFRSVLTDRRSHFEQQIDICDQDYRTALVDHGMNPDDTMAKAGWVHIPQVGTRVWMATKTPTNDPEELLRRARLARAPDEVPVEVSRE